MYIDCCRQVSSQTILHHTFDRIFLQAHYIHIHMYVLVDMRPLLPPTNF